MSGHREATIGAKGTMLVKDAHELCEIVMDYRMGDEVPGRRGVDPRSATGTTPNGLQDSSLLESRSEVVFLNTIKRLMFAKLELCRTYISSRTTAFDSGIHVAL